jgi:hypothetical protein
LAHHSLPAVFRRDSGLAWQPFLTATDLQASPDLPHLIQLIQERL